MSSQQHPYAVNDPEAALKYAIRHIDADRVEIVEGRIRPVLPSWDHESVGHLIREQLRPVLDRIGCLAGSGDLDLPGTSNWYVPDLAVVANEAAKGGAELVPAQTRLIVEITSEGTADTDRTVKRRRYAEYRAPLYLLVDRQERACTLFAVPGELGYTRVEGPYPFGTPVTLPEPFRLDLDTSEF